MELKLTSQLFLFTMLLGIVWSCLSIFSVYVVTLIIQKLRGDKQVIERLVQDKIKLRTKNLDLLDAQAGLKNELNKMIDENKVFQSRFQPSPQSKKLDKFLNSSTR